MGAPQPNDYNANSSSGWSRCGDRERGGLEKRTSATPVSGGIAVLPFENLSADPQNAFLADGVQDEILNDLAKVADLKVISRTSVMGYKSGARRNLHKIGTELGVTHVVDGSVQRAGNRVRVSAQLIDAKTNTHLWAESYDRPLEDVFTIQNDIAKAIAGQLQAELSPKTTSAIEELPTKDFHAYELYVRAKLLLMTPLISGGDCREAARLLDLAIARDPDFFLAYCLIAKAHSKIYFLFDHTSARRDLADRAVKAAFRLRPKRVKRISRELLISISAITITTMRGQNSPLLSAHYLTTQRYFFRRLSSMNARAASTRQCLTTRRRSSSIHAIPLFFGSSR